jgi:hypothetical protein
LHFPRRRAKLSATEDVVRHPNLQETQMKLFKTIAATACALAVASAAQAAEYKDSSENYEMNHMLATGDNGGTGFGAWEIESHGSGEGWAGCGIWDPSANDFQGDWAGKTRAFGIIGKGDSYGINAYRPFRAPLAVGDSFSLEMAVNWDGNGALDSLKGFALLAKGGTFQALTINHRSNPGNIAINGETNSAVLNAFGTYPIKWKFTAKDESTITVSANSREDGTTLYEEDWTVETSAIDGFRLQSSGQNAREDGAPEGEAQAWADRRQTYFDNFVLEIAGELPDLVDLELKSDDWAVSHATQTLSFTLARPSATGALDVSVKSSDESFVPSATVSFADGETEVAFTLDATLTGYGNYAKLTASAVGCNPGTFEVKGPKYRVNNGPDDSVSFFPGDAAAIWINWDGEVRDDSKVKLVATPEGVIDVPTDWVLPDEGEIYVQSSVKALAPGEASLAITYDDVEMWSCRFNVLKKGFSLSGPTSVKTGSTHTYYLSVVTDQENEPAVFSVTGTASATVTPDSFDKVYPNESKEVSLEFGDVPGSVTLSVATTEGELGAELPIEVTEPVDPSKFDSYVAYDDASLYEGTFNFDSTGAGAEGFQPWGVYKTGAEYGGTFVGGDDGGFPAILTDGQTMAIYANGGGSPDYAIFRPFALDSETGRPKDLQPGQKASVEFVVPESTGTLYVQFSRVWDGVPYKRCEVYAADYHVGVNVALGNDQEQKTELDWSANPRRIAVSLQRAADGSDYTLNLAGYNEAGELEDIFQHVVDSDVGEWGDGIQAIVIGAYNMGGGENMPFNKLAITQEEEPVKVRTIGIMGTWNMDATGDYDFYVGPAEAGDPIGTVALAVSPDDGRVALSADSVEVPGDDVAKFTVTVTSLPGEGEENVTYTITATPANAEIPPAEFNLTPTAAYVSLSSENWEHTTDETEIWLCLRASPSFYGTYAITSEDAAVLAVPEASASIDLNEGQTEAWFNVTIEGVGQAHIYATMGETVRDYGFTVNQGADVEQPEIPAPTVVKGKGLSWKASDLAGYTLRGTAALGDPPTAASWSDLVEGVDYETDGETVTVLYTSAYNFIAIVAK